MNIYILNSPICWIKMIFNSLKLFRLCSGHSYKEEERNIKALVTIGKCICCEKYSIGWERLS